MARPQPQSHHHQIGEGWAVKWADSLGSSSGGHDGQVVERESAAVLAVSELWHQESVAVSGAA